MQLPIVKPAPIVTTHETRLSPSVREPVPVSALPELLNWQTWYFPIKVWPTLVAALSESADKTNLSRFFSHAPWSKEELTEQRIKYLLTQTASHRLSAAESYLLLDDTLCEHVVRQFEYVDRHYNHSNQSYPLAHNLVTSHNRSGAVRLTIDLQIYRRYEEITRWSEFVKKHFPDTEIPKQKKERQKLHKLVDQTLL